MKSTHTLITLIIAGILSVLFGIGYVNLVTPNDKQAKLYDQQRESDIVKISEAIQSYRDAKDELPKTLKTLSETKVSSDSSTGVSALDSIISAFSSLTVRDPQTNTFYGYSYENQQGEKYKLCADFATDTNDKGDSDSNSSSSKTAVTLKHNKGKNVCIDYTAVKKQKTDSRSYSSDLYAIGSSGSTSSTQARDVRRKEDLNSLSSGLEQYYNDNQAYPSSLSKLTSENYLKTIPTDPSTGSSYSYVPLPAGGPVYTSFTLRATLENKNDKDIKSGTSSTYEVVNKQ